MAKFEYPEIDGMDAILLTLGMRHNCAWMEIYDSLQQRERIEPDVCIKDTELLKNKECGFITLLSEHYPENLKSIYKPPFSVFYKGDLQLFSGENARENTLTAVGDYKEIISKLDKPTNLIWVNKTQDEMKEIIKLHPTGNIFYSSEMKGVNSIEVEKGNAIISEIWERSREKDYSNQAEERLYLGISKKAIVAEHTPAKELASVKNYSRVEDIQIMNAKSKEKTIDKGFEMGA